VTEGTRTLELRSISALYQAKASALVLPRDRDDLARRLVEEFGGQLGKTTGDGILATLTVSALDLLRGCPPRRTARHRPSDPG
jgi:hypothetical protein